jgi:hypothetical protein
MPIIIAALILGLGFVLGFIFKTVTSGTITRGRIHRFTYNGSSDAQPKPAFPRVFTQRCESTSVTIELREMLEPGAGVWIRRGAESMRLELKNSERTIFPIVLSKGVPVAFALAYRAIGGQPDQLEFSRLIAIFLPAVNESLQVVRLEDVPIHQESEGDKFWISRLEAVSDDSLRLLVSRADVVTADSETRIEYHTFRFCRDTREWSEMVP